MYNYPTNVSKLSDLLVWSSEVTGGYFGIAMILLLFGVVFISSVSLGVKRAFTLSSWLSFFLAIGFFMFGVVSPREVFIASVFISISIVWLWLSKD